MSKQTVGGMNLPNTFNKYMIEKFNTDYDGCITTMQYYLEDKALMHEELKETYELIQRYNKKMKLIEIGMFLCDEQYKELEKELEKI
jgi:hypothetical protein